MDAELSGYVGGPLVVGVLRASDVLGLFSVRPDLARVAELGGGGGGVDDERTRGLVGVWALVAVEDERDLAALEFLYVAAAPAWRSGVLSATGVLDVLRARDRERETGR